MTNPQQTEGLTAEQIAGVTPELASGDISAKALASVLEAGAKNQRPISRQYRSGNFNATADAEFICAAVKHFIDRPSPPAQEAVACDAEDICLCIKALREVQMTELTKERDRISQVIYRLSSALKAVPIYTSPPSQSSLIKVLTEALEEIADPISFIQNRATAAGDTVNGPVAIALAGDANYLKRIARSALALVKEMNQ